MRRTPLYERLPFCTSSQSRADPRNLPAGCSQRERSRNLMAVFFVKHRKAVEGYAATALTREFGQLTHQFKPDFMETLGAWRKSLARNERYLMGQPMLSMNHAIDAACRDTFCALIDFSHTGWCTRQETPAGISWTQGFPMQSPAVELVSM